MGTGPRTLQDSCLPITAGTPGQVGWEGRAEPGTCEAPFLGVPDPLPSTSACSCSCPLSSLQEEAPGWHGFFLGSFLASKSSVTFDLKRLSLLKFVAVRGLLEAPRSTCVHCLNLEVLM